MLLLALFCSFCSFVCTVLLFSALFCSCLLFCFSIFRSFWLFLVHFSAHVCSCWLICLFFLPLPGSFLPFEYFFLAQFCSFWIFVCLFLYLFAFVFAQFCHICAHFCPCLLNLALCSSLFFLGCIYGNKCKYMQLCEISCVSQGANTVETVSCMSLAKPPDDTAVILASGDVWGSNIWLQCMTLYGRS